MGKIVSNFFIALDGVVEAPDQWHFSYFNDEMGAVVGAGMETNKAFLMGRKLYDEWAAYWPESTDEPFATYFNTMPKYVDLELARRSRPGTTRRCSPETSTRSVGSRRPSTATSACPAAPPRFGGYSPTGCSTSSASSCTRSRSAMVSGCSTTRPTHRLQLVNSDVLSTGVLNLTYAPAS